MKTLLRRRILHLIGLGGCLWTLQGASQPNLLFILTDDQRHDALGKAGLRSVRTPNLDRLASRGVLYRNAFVTLSMDCPSRAAVLTGLYGGANGVTSNGKPRLKPGIKTAAHYLGKAGYQTGVIGQWSLGNTPAECGFTFARTFKPEGPFHGRQVNLDGATENVPGFIDAWVANQSRAFMEDCQREGRPFFLWVCLQAPHPAPESDWNIPEKTLALYEPSAMPVPKTWQEDLTGKPSYLPTSQNRQEALRLGNDRADSIRRQWQRYLAAVTEADATIGLVLEALRRLNIEDNTAVCFMGDSGWFLGEHGLTGQVLPYEESMRVPLVLAIPKSGVGSDSTMALNIDIPVTLLALAGVEAPPGLHGRNLLDSQPLPGDWVSPFRTSFLYEAPHPRPGSRPLWAVRTQRWKYIHTGSPESPGRPEFEELYDLEIDPQEEHNLASDPEHASQLEQLRQLLQRHRENPAHDADPAWMASLNGDIAKWMARAEDYLAQGSDGVGRIEAYAIYRLAARHGSTEAQAKLTELEARLGSKALQVARIDCAVCRRHQAEAAGLLLPDWLQPLRLNGLATEGSQRTALIGQQTVQTGDTIFFRPRPYGNRAKVECLEIGPDWVRIKLDGKEMKLSLKNPQASAHPHQIE